MIFNLTRTICFFFILKYSQSYSQLEKVETKPINIDHMFIKNNGQLGNIEASNQTKVFYEFASNGLKLYLTENGLSYFLYNPEGSEESIESESEPIAWERIDLNLINAKINVENIIAKYPGNNGVFNFINPNCPKGIYNLNEYRKLIIKDIYPNIDWEIYISESQGLKYDFIINSGADLNDLNLEYLSFNQPQLTNGNIEIETKFGVFQENAPISFINESSINSNFYIYSSKKLSNGGFSSLIKIEIDNDKAKQVKDKNLNSNLIVDPIIKWSTFYGGELAEGGTCIATDSKNDVYVGGYRRSLNCPLYDNGISFFQGVFSDTWGALILKFNEFGKRLWVTHYDGSYDDEIRDIAIDNNDNVVFVGFTDSPDLPLVGNGTFFEYYPTISSNAGFIVEFTPNGNLEWATHFGNGYNLSINSVDFDDTGNLLITGRSSFGIPLVDNGTFFINGGPGYQRDAFVSKFDQERNLIWSTLLGGYSVITPGGSVTSIGNDSAMGVATDSKGNIYVTGQTQSSNFPLLQGPGYFKNYSSYVDAFLVKFDSIGNLIWSTCFGGSSDDWGLDVYVDKNDNVYISGLTNSYNLPVTNGSVRKGMMDLYLFKFNQSGSLIWGTYVGGTDEDYATNLNPPQLTPETYYQSKMIAVDKCGNVFFGFETESDDIQTKKFCSDCYHKNDLSGSRNQFLMAFSSTGNQLGATYIGGYGRNYRCAITLDKNDDLWMTGEWSYVSQSSTYPFVFGDTNAYIDTTFNGNPDDVFIMKMEVTKAVNCIEIEEEEIIPIIVEMPNVFSPNQNNVNDYYQPIELSGIKSIDFKIINRWGNIVYQSNNLNFYWDGKDKNGKEVVEGTYFWILKAFDLKDNENIYHGSIQLIR